MIVGRNDEKREIEKERGKNGKKKEKDLEESQ